MKYLYFPKRRHPGASVFHGNALAVFPTITLVSYAISPSPATALHAVLIRAHACTLWWHVD